MKSFFVLLAFLLMSSNLLAADLNTVGCVVMVDGTPEPFAMSFEKTKSPKAISRTLSLKGFEVIIEAKKHNMGQGNILVTITDGDYESEFLMNNEDNSLRVVLRGQAVLVCGLTE